MRALDYNEILLLVSDLNEFADNAERTISTNQSNYNNNKNSMLTRHKSILSELDNTLKANCSSVQAKLKQTLSEANKVLSDIDSLERQLISVDKYYVKTKNKREETLAGTTSHNYDDLTDYFETLEKIKKDFNALTRKYSEDVLPGLLNGLNYLFSSQRKKDYEELIVLKNTTASFVKEIEEALPTIADENISHLRDQYNSQYGQSVDSQKREYEQLEQNYLASLDDIADKICANLDDIVPDEFLDYLSSIMDNYKNNIIRVNNRGFVQDEVLNILYVIYDVNYYVTSSIVASVIKDKCLKILKGNSIALPIMMHLNQSKAWIIQNNNPFATQRLIHSIMFSYLSTCPVGKLKYTIYDPENRGNSVSPFFDAKKKLPDLFGDKFYISREEFLDYIKKVNDNIESIIQNRLGNQCENVYKYAESTGSDFPKIELIVLFDFPKGFDEAMIAELKSIIRSGYKCGIYVILAANLDIDPNANKEMQQNIQYIKEASNIIVQNDENFAFGGLPINFTPMPDKIEFANYFSKYMLIFEGIRNRGIAFSPIIKNLADANDPEILNCQIRKIVEMEDNYSKNFAHTPDIKAQFPDAITMGNVLYPADIFSDCYGYGRIWEVFGDNNTDKRNEVSFVSLPLMFDLNNSFNLFFCCLESNSQNILYFTHHVLWSFLSCVPITKLNICVFDAEQRGNSIVPFLDFRKKAPDVFDRVIHTNQDSIYEKLRKLNDYIDEFILDKLGNRYKNILQYNANAASRAESLTLLVIYDFPAGMDGRCLDLLNNILRNGNRCGVYVVICHNPSITFSRYESIDEKIEQIMKYATVIDYKDGGYVMMPYNLKIQLPQTIDQFNAEEFVKEYIEKIEKVKKQGLSFRDILSEHLFSFDSSKLLNIPVGIGDGDSIVNMSIGIGSSHHGLIAGATGSGKSTLLHTLIMSSMLHYTPDMLNLYLMDFKSGTEFKVYESVKLPHIKLLALDAMQEFGESILDNLVWEMEKRGKLFKDAGQTSLSGYVKATGKVLPRILVIMDEFQILFNDATNRKVAMNCAELTKRIVTEGRAFGIHLLMATQSTKVISDLTLSHGTIEQMRIRVGLKCGESDARYLFSDNNDSKALEMMKGPIGTAVMNLDYTEQSNIGFRAAYCDDETQSEFLNTISERFSGYEYNLQVFEGGRNTDLLNYFEKYNISKTEHSTVEIHMGSLIKVAPPFVVPIDRKKKHNLLICGANEDMANNIVNNYMICALLNTNSIIYCVDGDIIVGDDNSHGFYDVLSKYSDRVRIADDRADIIKFINEVYTCYQSQKKEKTSNTIFFVIRNLQFVDVVKSMFKGEMIDESEYTDSVEEESPIDPLDPFASVTSFMGSRNNGDSLSVGEKMLKLVSDGSGFGIHFIVSSLEYQTVRESMYYGENILTKFPERVIFSLSPNDADNLIEGVSVAGLRDNTVYYTDGVKNTFQMKPYVCPNNNELNSFMTIHCSN